MQRLPEIVDRKALRRHRERAAPLQVDFLRQRNADDVQERLEEVNRTFTSVAIVSPTPAIWSDRLPQARTIHDEEVLDLDEGHFDLVIHDLCLHWANDPVGQLVQCRRALKPDGLMIATLFGGQTLHELRSSLALAESMVSGGLSPRVAPMAEIRDIGGLLQRAGFALPVADSTTLTVTYPSALTLMHDLRAMGETNALSGRIRHFTRKEVIDSTCDLYSDHFSVDGRIQATFEILTLTGWAPADNQPKALRPGSASTRLADALGATEQPLKPSEY